MKNALITAEELHKIAGRPGVKVLDASYGLPPAPGCIADAIDFDIDIVADLNAAQTHTLPSPERFGEMASMMGIANSDRIVVYDRAGLAMAAARVWWMFRVFGHDNVQILDGGLPAWMKAHYPLSEPGAIHEPQQFKASFRPGLFRRKQEMLDNLKSRSFTVLDARDAKRYSGEAPEPRPGVAAGHIPGSLSVPYMSLIDPATGLFKAGEALKDAMGHLDLKKNYAASCGSGVTACVVALGLFQLGNDNAAIYGGSWAEWGADPALPKSKGNAP